MRFLSYAAIAMATFLAASETMAAPSTTCADAYVQGQRLRNKDQLLKAREQFLQCTQTCTGSFLNECSEWLRDVEKRIPSIAIRAQDPEGVDLPKTRVTVDDVVVATTLDGKPIAIDVGSHRLKLESDGFITIDRELVAADGEIGRIVAVTMQRAAPPIVTPPNSSASAETRGAVTATTERPVPWTIFALGGVALVGGAGFGIFGLRGDSERKDLDAAGCAPRCPSGDVDRMSTSYLIADIALGVGIVAAAAAVILFVVRPTKLGATSTTTTTTTTTSTTF